MKNYKQINKNPSIFCNANLKKNPLELCNADIQAIGERYFIERGTILFRSDADHLAQKLVDYNEESSAQEKWAYLAKCYRAVPDHNCFTARQIKQIFCEHFPALIDVLAVDKKRGMQPMLGVRSLACVLEGHANNYFKNLHQRQCPQSVVARVKNDPAKLTMSMVQEIGRDYLQRHGQSDSCFSCFFRRHNRHAQAKELKHFNKISNSDCWQKLAEIYAQLPNNRGEMATEIRNVFKSAYGRHAAQLDTLGSTKKVSLAMQQILTHQSTRRKLALQLMST